MKFDMVRLSTSDGTWDAFQKDWEAQCFAYDEAFDTYAEGTFNAVADLLKGDNEAAGVYAVHCDGKHYSMCQLNLASIPGYSSPVLRVRFLTLCPEYDFGDKRVDEYVDVLVATFAMVLAVSDGEMPAQHVKFHLKSPADRQFFAMLGRGLKDASDFHSVQVRGAWLYATKA